MKTTTLTVYSKSLKSYTVYPGETFNVSVVAVGQRNENSPYNSQRTLPVCSHTCLPSFFQYLQAAFNSCTTLNYTVFSLLYHVGLELYANGPCSTFSNELQFELDVYSTCPARFKLSVIKRSCACNQRLGKYTNHSNAFGISNMLLT